MFKIGTMHVTNFLYRFFFTEWKFDNTSTINLLLAIIHSSGLGFLYLALNSTGQADGPFAGSAWTPRIIILHLLQVLICLAQAETWIRVRTRGWDQGGVVQPCQHQWRPERTRGVLPQLMLLGRVVKQSLRHRQTLPIDRSPHPLPILPERRHSMIHRVHVTWAAVPLKSSGSYL